MKEEGSESLPLRGLTMRKMPRLMSRELSYFSLLFRQSFHWFVDHFSCGILFLLHVSCTKQDLIRFQTWHASLWSEMQHAQLMANRQWDVEIDCVLQSTRSKRCYICHPDRGKCAKTLDHFLTCHAEYFFRWIVLNTFYFQHLDTITKLRCLMWCVSCLDSRPIFWQRIQGGTNVDKQILSHRLIVDSWLWRSPLLLPLPTTNESFQDLQSCE